MQFHGALRLVGKVFTVQSIYSLLAFECVAVLHPSVMVFFINSSLQKNRGGGAVAEVVNGLVDEVGEKMAKPRDGGGKVAKEVKEGGRRVGIQRKPANPAKK